MGVCSNAGMMEMNGAKDTSSVTIKGMVSNVKNATWTVNDGGIRVASSGSLTNDGLLSMNNGTDFFKVNGLVTNNGFYNYGAGNMFASGAGTITDLGLPANTEINAGDLCTIDLAQQNYEWFVNQQSIGTADTDGSLTFQPESLSSDEAFLTTSLPDVEIRVIDICDAVISSTKNIQENLLGIKIYPTLMDNSQTLVVNFEYQLSDQFDVQLFNAFGMTIYAFPVHNEQSLSLDMSSLAAGQNYLRVSTPKGYLTHKIVKM